MRVVVGEINIANAVICFLFQKLQLFAPFLAEFTAHGFDYIQGVKKVVTVKYRRTNTPK